MKIFGGWAPTETNRLRNINRLCLSRDCGVGQRSPFLVCLHAAGYIGLPMHSFIPSTHGGRFVEVDENTQLDHIYSGITSVMNIWHSPLITRSRSRFLFKLVSLISSYL